ncbi:MAG TPA: hypothetical protein VMV46_13525 [Thermoanaerobaculia bacterium]|nr:hypothetical protein [Thermoanaerobaculia bacterium]
MVAQTCVAGAATQPLATAATNLDGIEIELVNLERKGNVLTVKWAVRNTGNAEAQVMFSQGEA